MTTRATNGAPAFSGAQAYRYLKALTVEIGPRHGGSKGEQKAARYIRDVFKSHGLKASLFPYKTHTFDTAASSLSFPGIGAVECVPAPCCESTPAKGVTADLAMVETGHEMCLDASMKGKVLITIGGFGGKHMDALVAIKPAGLIMIGNNLHKRHFRGKYGADSIRRHGSVPMVHVTYEDGLRIVEARPARCTVRVTTKGERMDTSYNPIGELRGTEKPDEIIVIGGHYDSVWGSQGSQDNAGGMAIVMELARLFARHGSRRTLRFMGFGAEEHGLCGSTAYVKKLKDEDDKLKKNEDFVRDGLKSELDRIIFMVNIDVQGVKLGTNSAWTLGHGDIPASVRLLAAELLRPHNTHENACYSSDNAPFGKAGVPSVSFGRYGADTGYGHTDQDVIDHCDAAGLARAGEFIELWMKRYITDSLSFPFSRTLPGPSAESVKNYFGEPDPFKYKPVFPKKYYKPRKSGKTRARRRGKK